MSLCGVCVCVFGAPLCSCADINTPLLLFKQAGKTSNSALLQVLVGFLVGAVFVSVFTSGHSGEMVRATAALFRENAITRIFVPSSPSLFAPRLMPKKIMKKKESIGTQPLTSTNLTSLTPTGAAGG